MVRNYGFLPVFNEASGNLDLQPNAQERPFRNQVGPVLCPGTRIARPILNGDERRTSRSLE